MVKPHDVIKWQNVQKLCINTLTLPYTTSSEKLSLVYLIYLKLFKDHFWLRDLGLSTARREFCRLMVGRVETQSNVHFFFIEKAKLDDFLTSLKSIIKISLV